MNIRTLVKHVEMYTQHNLARYIDELREICLIDSGTSYKPGLDRMASILESRMQASGMDTTIFQHEQWGNDILGKLRGEGKECIVLLGHIDTVYPVGTAATRPLRRDDTRLYAPGVSDMKGCILSALFAIEALLAQQCRSFKELRFLCVSDEEISQRHSADLIQQTCRDCHKVFVLESARANGDIVSARKGTAWYTLSAHGRSAHAGVEPEKGHNAIVELVHQLTQFHALHGMYEGLSINPGVIQGGTVPNVIPEYAQARFDVRFLQADDRLHLEKLWHDMLLDKRIPAVELTLEREAFCNPMICTQDSMKLVYQAQEIAQMLGFSLNHTLTGGTSDARFVSDLALPVLDGLGPIGGLDHSPNEFLLIESIAPRTALLAGLIAQSTFSS